MAGFSKIIGHQKIIEHLKGAIEFEKVSHAYIFEGEDGIGKKMRLRHEALKYIFIFEGILNIGIHLLVDPLHRAAVEYIVPPQKFSHVLERGQSLHHLRNCDFPFIGHGNPAPGEDVIYRGLQSVGQIQ